MTSKMTAEMIFESLLHQLHQANTIGKAKMVVRRAGCYEKRMEHEHYCQIMRMAYHKIMQFALARVQERGNHS